jgi:hypothetical protein
VVCLVGLALLALKTNPIPLKTYGLFGIKHLSQNDENIVKNNQYCEKQQKTNKTK